MAEPAKEVKKEIVDQGLEIGVQNLTEEQLRAVMLRI